MKNLVNQIVKENKKQISEFKAVLKECKDIETLKYKWLVNQYITPANDKKDLKVEDLKVIILKRFEMLKNKDLQAKILKVATVINSGTLLNAQISVSWVKSSMWGANPTCEIQYTYLNNEGLKRYKTVKSRSVESCGFDRLSTAISEAFNQINEGLKPLYILKNKKASLKNSDVFGYGSGYGILPCLEGGYILSCYLDVFNSIGYDFKSVSSGKMFNVYEIAKK